MKIKTRRELLSEYNQSHPARNLEPDEAVRAYFKARGWNLEKACEKARKKLAKIEEGRVYKTIRVIMYEYPMKTDRPRTVNGHTFSPNAKENHDYFEKAIKGVIKTLRLISTPSEIVIDAYFEMPKQVPPDEVILFEGKVLDIVDTPDWDNIGKCYSDIQKFVTILDDDIFHAALVRKFYSVTPRVEITITYIESHESDYIYRKLKNRKSVKTLMEAGQLELKKL
ncbi:RusA family crossover junction endodeoxyribonuclease [uncultured Duncaniella sp.]|uniref:RusA family crossover junction endodeoxyribonuclease n=1 Tax=uncultured Duncaniella sp. TaxID=2768039 RepID=UPI00261A823E|nr:RusA family crossover junction endodeoxyribonuclease [uncultured Duncaniella sp.]